MLSIWVVKSIVVVTSLTNRAFYGGVDEGKRTVRIWSFALDLFGWRAVHRMCLWTSGVQRYLKLPNSWGTEVSESTLPQLIIALCGSAPVCTQSACAAWPHFRFVRYEVIFPYKVICNTVGHWFATFCCWWTPFKLDLSVCPHPPRRRCYQLGRKVPLFPHCWFMY